MRNQTHNRKPGVSHRRPAVLPSPGGGRVVRLPEVLEITGLSRTTIWRRERYGSLPSPFRLGGERTRAVGWREGHLRLDRQPVPRSVTTHPTTEALLESLGQRIHPAGV